jgi:hypothetical protein
MVTMVVPWYFIPYAERWATPFYGESGKSQAEKQVSPKHTTAIGM